MVEPPKTTQYHPMTSDTQLVIHKTYMCNAVLVLNLGTNNNNVIARLQYRKPGHHVKMLWSSVETQKRFTNSKQLISVN